MYLRASNVSIRFPVHGKAAGKADYTPVAGKLGGAVEMHEGHRYVHALEDVSIDLRQGDRLAIIGHNGSGKSTLLRVLAGIYIPHSGSVECDRPVSGLFNISLGFRLEATGYRNIVLKGLIAGKSRAEIERALPEIVAFTELGPYLHMPLRAYSQGMAMRLAFAIATAFSSEILLFDEWIGAGDAQFREKVVARMNSFVEAAHIVVIASHSAQLLRRIANKAIWLESGRIREAGPAADLIERYEAEAKQKAREQAALLRGPIRKENIVFSVTQSPTPASGGRYAGEVFWDVTGSGANAVDVLLVRPDGSQAMFAHGEQVGSAKTGAWLRPGLEFRLLLRDSDEVLATTVVAEHDAMAGKEAV